MTRAKRKQAEKMRDDLIGKPADGRVSIRQVKDGTKLLVLRPMGKTSGGLHLPIDEKFVEFLSGGIQEIDEREQNESK